MLPEVSGMFAIPSEPQLKITETTKGAYLSFSLVAQDSNDSKQQYHRYFANLWVPADDVSKWKEKLQAGNVFILAGGTWKMRESEQGKFPLPILDINYRKFKLLKNPLWSSE